ncbi:MAG TPA: rhodanese-like domain-containing protein [Longimicrobiales bacterium]
MKRIMRQQLEEDIRARRVTVVEALPERYYVDGHLPGALHLPHDQVTELAPALLGDKHAQIVVYCANVNCQNSHKAAHALTALGYRNVAVYAEGKQDWIEAGLPLEKGPMMSRAA